MAAAIGVGLPVDLPTGSMIIDIGGGTSEIAVIALSGIVSNISIRIAGDELDESIVAYLKKNYNLLIGERTAEEIKMKIGSAYPMEKEDSMDIKGRDLVAGVPKTMKVTSSQIREAIANAGCYNRRVRQALEQTPPELASIYLNAASFLRWRSLD
jgi:rod shape-determining protein MreB